MIIGNIPEISNKLPEKPKKTTHETGEIFQMYLNRKIKETENDGALGAGDRVSEATRQDKGHLPLL
jgi:hypothetical protein